MESDAETKRGIFQDLSLKVHDLPLQDHKLEVDNEIKSLQFELIHGTKDSIKTKQSEGLKHKLNPWRG